MRKKIVRLTESDLLTVIRESTKRILKEEYGWGENFSDEDLDSLIQQTADGYARDDANMPEFDEFDKTPMNPDPSDSDLYR